MADHARPAKKQKSRAATDSPLQSILLADSFQEKFRPITLERPKVLLPLLNRPLIDYTLSWLESEGVDEVFVFCCAHSKQIIDYLDKSGWLSKPNFRVTTIESRDSFSPGDALRLIHKRDVIHGDFVLIGGDTVTNMSLTEALQEHKDNSALMTMVIDESLPSLSTHESCLGIDEIFLVIDSDTKQLLYYKLAPKDLETYRLVNPLEEFRAYKPSVSFYNHKQDCYVDICSPEVLSIFTNNVDYQHLRHHFVDGILVDNMMGYKIFTHEIERTSAKRIDNFRSYDSISKSLILRTLLNDDKHVGTFADKLNRVITCRPSVFRDEVPVMSKSHCVRSDSHSVIGKGTSIGNNTTVLRSVIGEGCVIGLDVTIEGCYIWNNVTIEDGCKLKHALICDGVRLKSGAVLNPGVVLSFNVVIGQQFVVPAYSKVSLLQQPIKQESDKELEIANQNSSSSDSTFTPTSGDLIRDNASLIPNSTSEAAFDVVGAGGAGYIWPVCDGSPEKERRHSVAPIPAADNFAEPSRIADVDLCSSDSEDVDNEDLKGENRYSDDSKDDINKYINFEKKVEAIFLQAVRGNVKENDIILEVNSLLSLASNMIHADCACALFYSMIKLALETTHNSASELHANAATLITTWQFLMKHYLHSEDDEVDLIAKLEQICRGIGKNLSPFFSQILSLLCKNGILHKNALLLWASEQKACERYGVHSEFFNQSKSLIQGLNEAQEEEEEEEDW